MMGLGTMAGGWRVIRTLGMGLAELKPIHGFAAETAASGVLLGAAAVGLPVSTTHCITASVMGVGATKRLSAVRWGVGQKILYAWILTLPSCAALGAVLSWLLAAAGLR
jgi:PiT family inorganic phosphate transporter